MRYKDNDVRFKLLESTLRKQFKKHKLEVHLAKDRKIVDDLWDNICIYMLASKYGVVVFEQAHDNDFNPNVSLELGFMLSMGKRILLLKEDELKTLPTDVVGKLYDSFNISNPDTIKDIVDKWVKDVIPHY